MEAGWARSGVAVYSMRGAVPCSFSAKIEVEPISRYCRQHVSMLVIVHK